VTVPGSSGDEPSESEPELHGTAGQAGDVAARSDEAGRFSQFVPPSARRARSARPVVPVTLFTGSREPGGFEPAVFDDHDRLVRRNAVDDADDADDDASAFDDEDDAHPGDHRRDTLITTVAGLAIYGLSLFTGPLLARSLGVSDRGTYAAVWAPTQILGWLLMLGIPAATTYFARRDNRVLLDNTAWLLTAAVGLPVFAVLWPLAPLFLHRHPPEAVFWFRMFLGAMLLVLPMQNAYEYCRARRRTVRFNVYRGLPSLLTTVLVVGLFLTGSLDLRTALFVTWLANLVGALCVIGCERTWPRLGRRRFDRELFRLQIAWGAKVWVGTLSNMVLARFDQFLMVGIVAPDQLGLYAIAVTAAGVSAPVAQGVGFAFFPHLIREDDPEARDARTRQGFRWVLAGSLAVCVPLALVVPWLLPRLFGPQFSGSTAPLFVLLPGQLMWNLAQVFKTRLDADNRPGAGSKAIALGAVITVVGVPLAVPQWGIMGAAVVTTLSQTAFCAAGWWAVRRGRLADAADESTVTPSRLVLARSITEDEPEESEGLGSLWTSLAGQAPPETGGR
jgi:O-antigen/teichoic acid export membrane protein